MDKRVIFAVAGSGKTTYILDNLDLEKKSLIVTYTIENTKNIEDGIKIRFGFIPPNITLMTYFSFVYSFCLVPFMGYQIRPTGISYDGIPPRFAKRNTRKHYVTSNRMIYANRVAKLISDSGTTKKVISRLEKYYDNFFIDEVQDFAANDFNLLMELAETDINILLVGDFYQHTFDTSRDGQTQKNLHLDFNQYLDKFKKSGVEPDTETLSNSYRCSETTCDFISKNLAIPIKSHGSEKTEISLIKTQAEADDIFINNNIVKLFYNNSSKYDCFSNNWGKSKGQDCYQDVCVVLNGISNKLMTLGELAKLTPSSKSKFYVACTRAKGNLYFVSDKLYKKYKQ